MCRHEIKTREMLECNDKIKDSHALCLKNNPPLNYLRVKEII